MKNREKWRCNKEKKTPDHAAMDQAKRKNQMTQSSSKNLHISRSQRGLKKKAKLMLQKAK